MGKFLDNFKKKSQGLGQTIDKTASNVVNKPKDQFNNNPRFKNPNSERVNSGFGDTKNEIMMDDFKDDFMYDDFNSFGRGGYDDVMIQPSQKPESFHHFILENQYKDLEKSIRGVKDVWDKETQTWKTKRKDVHCFTDEEAEEILRTAQSHLSTDIKLSFINIDTFGLMMDALYEQLEFLFESISEYRYGRYGEYQKQYEMKLQNNKIFLELWTRVQANYSRAIKGAENIATHQSVKGQESLQNSDRDFTGKNVGYS